MNTLDELEEIKELVNNDKHFKYKNIVNFNCESIEKTLKALEIIKKKRVDLQLIKSCNTIQEYYEKANRLYGANYNKELLTEEEFNLLKEVLENE